MEDKINYNVNREVFWRKRGVELVWFLLGERKAEKALWREECVCIVFTGTQWLLTHIKL